MNDPSLPLALASPPPGGEAGSPFASLILMALIFGIFYFVLIMPMRSKQKKLEQTIQALKSGDKVIVNPGIFATIVSVDDDSFHVRVDDKVKIRILKSAVAGRQPGAAENK